MAYSDQTDLNNMFGSYTITKWLNPNNEDSPSTSARLTWAQTSAYADMQSVLAFSKYAWPIANKAGTTPQVIVDIETVLVGVRLYTSLGTKDIQYDEQTGMPRHRYTALESWAYRTMDEIVKNKRKLDAN